MTTVKTAYFYPFEHKNKFVLNTILVLRQLGCDVKPLKRLYALGNLRKRKRNIVVLNWYEDQLYRQNFSPLKRLLYGGYFVLSLLVFPLLSSKVYWVRHNYKPHSQGEDSFWFRLATRLLNWVADEVVTIEPARGFDSQLVKHPLYVTDKLILDVIDGMSDKVCTEQSDGPRFLYFGAIKPYKGLTELLDIWPADRSLTIAGLCKDADYTAQILSIVQQRALSVTWMNEYVEESQLEQLVSEHEFVLLPHKDGTMISSGTFYFAISLGANIIGFDSDFIRLKAEQHNFVHRVSHDNLAASLAHLQAVPRSQVLQQALKYYGEAQVRDSWASLLSK